jgi:hypothetical protein
MGNRLTERVDLPDGTSMEGPLLGSQVPRFSNIPDRHQLQVPDCPMCAIERLEERHDHGCGDHVSTEVLEWAEGFGYMLDPWQKWTLRHMMGRLPDGLWAAPDVVMIVARQNGKGTVLEVRELAGVFLLGEELIIHTSHQLKTSLNHLQRLTDTIKSYPSLEKKVASIVTGNGKEAIKLKPRRTIIFGSGGKEISARRTSKIEFHARSGAATSRGFSCDCLVYDEAMILSNEQVGASMPTMRARPNPQMIYAASAGLEDGSVSQQLAVMRSLMIKGDPQTFGLEFSANPHDEGCPRDELKGRESNYYIVCDKHDDRDDPRTWAKANPGMGERITLATTRRELAKMPPAKFDIEILSIGNWPSAEEPWETISKPAWKLLVNEDPGFPTPPLVFAFDVSEDGKSATVMGAWEHKQKRIVIEMPREGHRQGTKWVIDYLHERYMKRRPLAIAVPKSGPAAGLLDDAIRKWGDRVYPVGPAEEAAAFAFMLQQVKEQKLWHFGEALAPTLWQAVGRAGTRVVGDGGKAWSRRDAESDISPITAATLAAYVLNKKRRSYDLSNTVA